MATNLTPPTSGGKSLTVGGQKVVAARCPEVLPKTPPLRRCEGFNFDLIRGSADRLSDLGLFTTHPFQRVDSLDVLPKMPPTRRTFEAANLELIGTSAIPGSATRGRHWHLKISTTYISGHPTYPPVPTKPKWTTREPTGRTHELNGELVNQAGELVNQGRGIHEPSKGHSYQLMGTSTHISNFPRKLCS